MIAQPPDPQSRPEGPVNPLLAFLTAVQFLTISPPFIRRAFTAGELGQATGFFPLVGVGIGGILIGADFIFGKVFAPPLQAALLLAVWVLLSGALHLDGFLDACDGLLGGFTPESRLRILKDEHKGAFAVTAGIVLLLVKFAAL
jgi:adenosylcobinamide-GDP ribazoletransferase